MSSSDSPAIRVPSVLTVFGATGDLFAIKIVPALYLLHKEGRLPALMRVVGFGRQPISTRNFQKNVINILTEKNIERNYAKASTFATMFLYTRGSFGNLASFVKLKKLLDNIDSSWGLCGAKAFYLAVPPKHFRTIFKKLDATGLDEGCDAEGIPARIMVEKPFGHNENEAQELNRFLDALFGEKEIYRIDHYLVKPTLRALLMVRVKNPLLERSLSRVHIEKINVRLLETIGVEHRGLFYDKVGAFLDVGQNHLLEMLALALMPLPRDFSARSLRAARAKFINTLPKLLEKKTKEGAIRAQYKGYRTILGVKPASKTETYFKFNFTLRGKRYGGVPVTLEAGKRMKRVHKDIVITLKAEKKGHGLEKIVIELEPKAHIRLYYKNGRKKDIFADRTALGIQYTGQYAELIVEALRGDQTSFLSKEEVEAAWRFADPIITGWKNNLSPLRLYAPNKELQWDKKK